MRVVRAVRASARSTGRGLGRVWRWSSTAGGDRRSAILVGLAWSIEFGLFWIGFGTAGKTYEMHTIGLGLAPFLGALAGLPFGFVATPRPAIGWAVSVAAAYLLAVTLPLQPGTVWSWTVVHGLVMFALLFAVCARERWWRGLGAWLITATLFFWGTPIDERAGWVVAVSAVAVFGLLAGTLARTRRSLERQERLTSQEKGRRLVLEERTRIARDLHDIVAHHMSLVVVQAETAPYRLPDVPAPVRAELESISASARSALTETRALLSVLRQDGQQAEHAPQPGIEQIEELVDGARRAGVPIETAVRGSLQGLRPGTSLAAYRILQEALANASRHAPGAAVRLDVSRDDDTLTLSVVNAPGSRAEQPDGTVGHGITGMRERVSAEGGGMTIGPTRAGGFAVRATLPLAG